MATVTLGTTASTSIPNAIAWGNGIGNNGAISAADFATISQAIRPDSSVTYTPASEGSRLDSSGLLYLPKKRGVIRLIPGDYIGVDSLGWPIVVSAYSIANGLWVHS